LLGTASRPATRWPPPPRMRRAAPALLALLTAGAARPGAAHGLLTIPKPRAGTTQVKACFRRPASDVFQRVSGLVDTLDTGCAWCYPWHLERRGGAQGAPRKGSYARAAPRLRGGLGAGGRQQGPQHGAVRQPEQQQPPAQGPVGGDPRARRDHDRRVELQRPAWRHLRHPAGGALGRAHAARGAAGRLSERHFGSPVVRAGRAMGYPYTACVDDSIPPHRPPSPRWRRPSPAARRAGARRGR
jgi:hypothetical protein